MPDLAKGWAEDEWQYSGHYPVQDLDTGMGREHLNQESLKLEADETWTTLQPFKPTGVSVNPGDRYVDAPENCLFYVAKIFSIEKAGFYELAFDSDDGMKVWVNGKLVHTFTGARGLFFPGEDLVPVWLRQGSNIVVIKVVNAIGTAGFAFDVRGRTDQLNQLKRYHARLAAGKKPKFVLHNLTEATPQQLLELTQQAVLFQPERSYEKLDNALANPVQGHLGGLIPATSLLPQAFHSAHTGAVEKRIYGGMFHKLTT